jgi:hypothetical protein
MSSKFKIVGQLVIDDKGNLGVVDKKAKKLNQSLDNTGKSARTADRNLKGAAQASSNTTKNFSKMAQGIEGGLVPAYATLAASLFAITAVFQGLKEAANLKNQQRGLELFSQSTGKNMLGVAQAIRTATDGIISFKEAAQAAAITTAAGFSAQQVTELAEGAKLASVALGRDMGDSFQRLIRGVTKAEPELLDELGIILRLDIATRKFADANGLVADKLTIAQRQAAVFEEVSRQLTKNFGDFEEHAGELTNDFAKLETAFMQVIKNLAEFIGPLEAVADFLSRNAGAAALVFAGFVTSIAKQAFPALTNLTAALTTYGTNAQLRADQSVAAFTSASARFKLSGQEFAAVELRKNKTFLGYLKKREISEKNFFNKSDLNQRRSIRMMIVHMEKKAAAGKAINETELANFKLMLKRMEVANKGTMSRLVLQTQQAGAAIGAGISAAIVAPTALAQSGLAAMATFVASKLSPVFAALGAVVNGAFFIFTTGFILKFIYDLIFLTDEMKEKQDRINNELQRTDQLLQMAGATAGTILKKELEETAESAENIHSNILRTFRLIQSVGRLSQILELPGVKESAPDATISDFDKKTRESIANVIGAVLNTTVADPSFKAEAQNFAEEFAKRMKTTGSGGATFSFTDFTKPMRLADQIDIEKPETVTAFIDSIVGLVAGGGAMSIDELVESLNGFSTFQDTAEQAGKDIANLDDALKALTETGSQFSRKFRPDSGQALMLAQRDVLNQINREGQKGFMGAPLGPMNRDEVETLLRERLGLGEGPVDVEGIVGSLTTGANATAKLRGAEGAEMRLTMLKNEVSLLNTKKDAQSKLLLQDKKKLAFLQEEEVIKLKIDELEGGRSLIKSEVGLQNLNESIAKEREKLEVIKAQSKEYSRSISAVGIANDAMSKGLEDMFMKLIEGTANFADAFRGMMKMVLLELAKLAAMKMAATTMSFIGLADGGIIPMASGGVINSANRYSRGGIATEPTYLVGEGKYNEAVVPLPNGRSIPVEMNGSGATNVTINVDGASTASGGMDAETGKQLGHMIQAATMEIIQREKRPGGVLSR